MNCSTLIHIESYTQEDPPFLVPVKVLMMLVECLSNPPTLSSISSFCSTTLVAKQTIIWPTASTKASSNSVSLSVIYYENNFSKDSTHYNTMAARRSTALMAITCPVCRGYLPVSGLVASSGCHNWLRL